MIMVDGDGRDQGSHKDFTVVLQFLALLIYFQMFKNPYGFGFKRNWKMFLGLNNGR
jgi:hypothetical protein